MTTCRFCAAAAMAATLVGSPLAAAQGYPWRNHEANYPFVFGNAFDGHQQTRLTPAGDLAGFLYVRHDGAITTDGYPVARHADCNQAGDCRVGWIVHGRPGSALFLYHGVGDHPTWQVDRAEIPQPGAFSHFHFVGADPAQSGEVRAGYFLELRAIDRFCFVHHVEEDAVGSCAGIGGVPISPGIDIATHVNIVGSAPAAMPR